MPMKLVRKLARVEGYVWCDKNGEIHDDCLDPYRYGPPREEGEEDMRCSPRDHVAVYARHQFVAEDE